MKQRFPRLITIFTSICLLTLAACQIGNEDTLSDTVWVLTDLNGSKPIIGTVLSLEFEDGQISGNAGCNLYGGNYAVDGDQINFDSIYFTEMACQTPEGVMDQEQVYLGTLLAAVRFSQADSILTIFDDNGASLTFEPSDPDLVGGVDGKNDTTQVPPPTVTPDKDTGSEINPPWEYHTYQDPVTGILIKIPDTWIVTGIVEGERAILQSYPEDKYIGGEPFEEGDAKCDLNIQPIGTNFTEIIEQIKTSPMTSILSEESFEFAGGENGVRLEVDSQGKSISFVADLRARVVVLSCFGDLSQADEISHTLNQED